MTKQIHDRLDRWSWLGYPLGAVVMGGFLGSFAGKHPRGPAPTTVSSARDAELPVDALLWIAAFVGVLPLGAFLLGLASGEGGIRARVMNGLAVAIFVGVIIFVFLGGGVALCLALAVLSLWAGRGAGPYLGAVFGATSVAAAIGLAAICLSYLGRGPVGQYLVNKQREALKDIEEEVSQPQ